MKISIFKLTRFTHKVILWCYLITKQEAHHKQDKHLSKDFKSLTAR